MNQVRMLTAVIILGLAPIACAGPTAAPTPDAAAASALATEQFANGALIQTPVPTIGPEVAATGRALPRDPTAAEMQDGEHFAFVEAVVPGSPAMLVMDPAVMFGGDEADAASIADGNTTERHKLPNNFYIRDLETATVTLPISPSVVVELIALAADGGISDEPLKTSVETLTGWFAGTPISGTLLFTMDATQMLQSSGPPMDITTANGIITRIVEHYLP